MSAAEGTTPVDQQRRTFVPVAVVGLAATGFLAFAGHQAMLRVPGDDLRKLGAVSLATDSAAELEFPLAGALALVALACWGVILVARGRVRQAVACLAALAAGGVFAVLFVGGFIQNDDAAADISEQIGFPALGDRLPIESTVWFWPALVVAAVAVAAGVAAALLGPSWPEMGSRYDAPGAHDSKPSAVPTEERASIDLWKSMDEGQDPTTEPDESH
jgi:uncharacterized membrane protein (TIGR02234 family)